MTTEGGKISIVKIKKLEENIMNKIYIMHSNELSYNVW